jgi:hypothetical protein
VFAGTNTAEAALQFKDLIQQATHRGLLDEFTLSARRMADDLREHPLTAGESREPEAAGGFIRRVAFYPYICVKYGVHPAAKQVMITRIARNSM